MTLHTYTCEQRSDEWFALRCGMVTASTAARLVTTATPDPVTVPCRTCKAEAGSSCVSLASKAPKPIKTFHDERAADVASLPVRYVPATGDDVRTLTLTLLAERITGHGEDSYLNADMIRGIESEPYARDKYAETNDVTVNEVGLIVRDDWGFSIGVSPDGLVGDVGGIEVKSPRAKGHIATILADEVPAQHMPQIQTALLVTGRAWWDFVSFHGGLPLYTKRVYPDPAWHEAIVAAVRAFENNAATLLADYTNKTAGLPMTERLNDLELVF